MVQLPLDNLIVFPQNSCGIARQKSMWARMTGHYWNCTMIFTLEPLSLLFWMKWRVATGLSLDLIL